VFLDVGLQYTAMDIAGSPRHCWSSEYPFQLKHTRSSDAREDRTMLNLIKSFFSLLCRFSFISLQ